MTSHRPSSPDTTDRDSGAAGPSRPAFRHVVVVGGGISGLAAAWFLCRDGAEANVRVTVLEALPEVGGKLQTSEVAGLPVDAGAEALLARRPEATDLAQAVGLGGELVHPATTSASIWTRTAMRPLPGGHLMGVPAELGPLARSGLLSVPALARVLADRVLPRTHVEGDVAVGRYVAARMGQAVVDRLVEPLLGGVYAGHADRLSLEMTIPQLAPVARTERSLLAGTRRVRAVAAPAAGPVFAGVRGGVGRLPAAVARALAAELGVTIRTGTVVQELRRSADGWLVVAGPARETIDADAVVLAVPAPAAARLLEHEVPAAAARLRTVEYAGIAVVTLAFPRTAFPDVPPPGGDAAGRGPCSSLSGSGFLVPPMDARATGRTVKAATYSSLKWGWLAEADTDTIVIRTSIGRHGEEDQLERPDVELVTASVRDLRLAVGLQGAPVDTRVTRWQGSLPQYAVGHRSTVELVRQALAAAPGVVVCGAAYEGVGVPACIASARMAAGQLMAGWREAGEEQGRMGT